MMQKYILHFIKANTNYSLQEFSPKTHLCTCSMQPSNVGRRSGLSQLQFKWQSSKVYPNTLYTLLS